MRKYGSRVMILRYDIDPKPTEADMCRNTMRDIYTTDATRSNSGYPLNNAHSNQSHQVQPPGTEDRSGSMQQVPIGNADMVFDSSGCDSKKPISSYRSWNSFMIHDTIVCPSGLLHIPSSLPNSGLAH